MMQIGKNWNEVKLDITRQCNLCTSFMGKFSEIVGRGQGGLKTFKFLRSYHENDHFRHYGAEATLAYHIVIYCVLLFLGMKKGYQPLPSPLPLKLENFVTRCNYVDHREPVYIHAEK